MPFTFSHVAAVLPLKKSRFNFIAMAIGAMSPDFSYVVEIFGPVIHAHTIAGIFTFCAPLSFGMWWLFHRYLQQSWATIFPWIGPPLKEPSLLIALLSVIIGAFTHVVWDSFTHFNGWMVEALPPLRGIAFEYGRVPIHFFRILQYASTLFGGAAIFWSAKKTIYRSPTRLVVTSTKTLWTLAGLAMALTIVFSLRVFFWWLNKEPDLPAPLHFKLIVVLIAFRTLGATFAVVVGYPIYQHVARNRSRLRSNANAAQG